MIVLDTNVVSELMRVDPAAQVASWVRRQRRGSLTTTVVTVGEIRYGLARLPDGRRTVALREAADEMLASFADRLLPYDPSAADMYGLICAARERLGHPIGALDAQIAAICRSRGAGLATRNTKDFRDTGLEIVDPWKDVEPSPKQ